MRSARPTARAFAASLAVAAMAAAAAVVTAALFLVSGCTTVDQRLVIDGAGVGMPLSASGSVVLPGETAPRGEEGLVLGGRIDRSLSFTGRLRNRELRLELAPLFEAEEAAGEASAAINLRVELLDFRVPLAVPLFILRSGGSALTIAGLAVLASGLVAEDYPPYSAQTLSSGLIYLLPGLGTLGASWGLEALATTRWKLRVSADLVRPR